jgi:hypothetical protein
MDNISWLRYYCRWRIISMKKNYTVILVAALALTIFACTMPSEVRIKGSPDLRFSTNMSFDEIFSDMIADGFSSESDDLVVVDCLNTAYMTFIVYLPLFEDELYNNFIDLGYISGYDLPVPVRQLLNSDVAQSISLGGLSDYLDDFKYKNILSKLYISGSDIINHLSIEMTLGNGSVESLDSFNPQGNSGFNQNTWAQFTNISHLPDGGREINLTNIINNQEDLTFDYEIFVEPGTISQALIASDIKIKAELVIWVPLEFEASDNGATLILPVDFMGEEGKDLFGRDSAGKDDTLTDMLESLNLVIELNKNPFEGAMLVVKSGAIEIENELLGSSFDFRINEQNMQEINNPVNFPFVPGFELKFSPGGELKIPRHFRATYIYFNAVIDHTVKL